MIYNGLWDCSGLILLHSACVYVLFYVYVNYVLELRCLNAPTSKLTSALGIMMSVEGVLTPPAQLKLDNMLELCNTSSADERVRQDATAPMPLRRWQYRCVLCTASYRRPKLRSSFEGHM